MLLVGWSGVGWVYCLAHEAPFLGECRRSPRHFLKWLACLGYGAAPRPTLKKVLYCTRPFGGARDKLPPKAPPKLMRSFFKGYNHPYTHSIQYIIIHHHYVVPLAWISLTLSRHFSLLFITSGKSSGLHPVSSQSCWMYVRAGRPAFARSYVGIHRSTSIMSSSLLFQQCPACLVRLTWIVFVMRGRWPYSWCLVGCCRQDLFNIVSQHSCVIAV